MPLIRSKPPETAVAEAPWGWTYRRNVNKPPPEARAARELRGFDDGKSALDDDIMSSGEGGEEDEEDGAESGPPLVRLLISDIWLGRPRATANP
mmetsp:Transcript_31437/g.67523  ORF Transcript_31437/g.67523 Transcript_31437/m.67523 type:complete len:94 (+) Transcript_31437:141-422(+)